MIEKKKKTVWKVSEKTSLCCKAPMKLDSPASDVGVCTKCNRLAFNKDKQHRLHKNRYQSFKKIADDGLYNNTWGKKPSNYRYYKK
ncbi:MAG TPA: hypothetical protein DEG69_13995 [Flavobacteriaceae bacterium]|nr:hypothetical protein [Flavobacteriaceae bacterium]